MRVPAEPLGTWYAEEPQPDRRRPTPTETPAPILSPRPEFLTEYFRACGILDLATSAERDTWSESNGVLLRTSGSDQFARKREPRIIRTRILAVGTESTSMTGGVEFSLEKRPGHIGTASPAVLNIKFHFLRVPTVVSKSYGAARQNHRLRGDRA